jgi:magnesium chelatase family protein
MIARVKTLAHIGLNVQEVTCECHVMNGMPIFSIVGMADKSIQESRDRVRVVLKELSNYDENIFFPFTRITVNLAPAEVIKKGNQYDIAIILSILSCQGYITNEMLENYFFLGELNLDGSIKKIDNIVSYCLYLNEFYPNCKIFIPQDNQEEASYLTNGNIYSVNHIHQILDYVRAVKTPIPIEPKVIDESSFTDGSVMFEEVIGQKLAKRAITICAAGGHNMLMIGEQGCGKTLLSRALQSILPNLKKSELIEVAKIRSLIGTPTSEIMSVVRPFRARHHTSSMISLMGGGAKITPGEVTKAHKGVLFLDELTEYDKRTLDSLRQPLEDKIINISRATGTVTYPCQFQLIATMNPTSKGSFENKKDIQSNSGMKKISGPILDRFDLQLKMFKPKNLEISSKSITSTSAIRDSVTQATQAQLIRLGEGNKNANMSISQINQHCTLNEATALVLAEYKDSLDLSMRSYHKILKVARTIADLEGRELIGEGDIVEALQFRF